MKKRRLGRTELNIPAVMFGTSCLGNLYEALPEATKLETIREMFRQMPAPVALDSAGKYGAGLALEVIGDCLRQLNIPPANGILSNKLGWYRVPLRGPEPTFERGVWAGLRHDAESRISYAGIRQCYEQGCELLGAPYRPVLVSVHDPDEFLAMGGPLTDVLGAYRALFELKAEGKVQAVGIGAKDWRIIRTLAAAVDLDWVMLACSLTVYTHPPELLEFCAQLHSRGVGIINSAVFNAGFLTGGEWFDYRKPDPVKDAPLFAWRDQFHTICRRYSVNPAAACVQFGLAVPGVAAVALHTSQPTRIAANVATAQAVIPPEFWRALKAVGVLHPAFPYLG